MAKYEYSYCRTIQKSQIVLFQKSSHHKKSAPRRPVHITKKVIIRVRIVRDIKNVSFHASNARNEREEEEEEKNARLVRRLHVFRLLLQVRLHVLRHRVRSQIRAFFPPQNVHDVFQSWVGKFPTG